jgi:uncharacterized protein YegJ (DUF2314 family)
MEGDAMKRILFSLLLLCSPVVLTACSDGGEAETPQTVWEVPPRYIGSDMEAAFTSAKAEFPDFLTIYLNAPEGTEAYKVFVKKPSAKAEYRYNFVWVDGLEPVEDGFVGRIIEGAGDIDKSARDGKQIAFTQDEVFDWSFIGPNGIYGQFATRAELAKQAEKGTNVSALQARFRDLSDLPAQ